MDADPLFARLMGGLTDIQVRMVRDTKTWRQARFPRSKRKRIAKKWRKDRRNWRWFCEPVIPDGQAFTDGRTFYMNERTYLAFVNEVSRGR